MFEFCLNLLALLLRLGFSPMVFTHYITSFFLDLTKINLFPRKTLCMRLFFVDKHLFSLLFHFDSCYSKKVQHHLKALLLQQPSNYIMIMLISLFMSLCVIDLTPEMKPCVTPTPPCRHLQSIYQSLACTVLQFLHFE